MGKKQGNSAKLGKEVQKRTGSLGERGQRQPGEMKSESLELSPGTYYVEVESKSHWPGEAYSIRVETEKN